MHAPSLLTASKMAHTLPLGTEWIGYLKMMKYLLQGMQAPLKGPRGLIGVPTGQMLGVPNFQMQSPLSPPRTLPQPGAQIKVSQYAKINLQKLL